MTTAPNGPGPSNGSTNGDNRTWVLVVATAGWAAVTTVAVLLATGVWSIGADPSTAPAPSRSPGPGIEVNGPTRPGGRSVPRQDPPGPATSTRSAAGTGARTPTEATLALLPRQPTARDR